MVWRVNRSIFLLSIFLSGTFLLFGCASTSDRVWESEYRTEHPLVGKIWGIREEAYVTVDALESALIDSTYVLLGEKHDNPDHHTIQADLIRAMAVAGRNPCDWLGTNFYRSTFGPPNFFRIEPAECPGNGICPVVEETRLAQMGDV